MKNAWISMGALWGALAVGLGAFGAHGLKSLTKDPDALDWWHTAASYQLWHALALVGYGLFLTTQRDGRSVSTWPGFAFLLGSAVFSATLYAMALGAPRWLGAITPLGGSALIVAWVAFAWQALPRQ